MTRSDFSDSLSSTSMPSAGPKRLQDFRRLTFFALCFWFVAVVIGANIILANLQAQSRPNLPFGIMSSGGTVYAQDFAYNLLILRGIQERLVPRPYRLQDQERLIRQILPGMDSGMSHAYSPVSFVLAQPLLALSSRNAYLIFAAISGASTLLLFYFYLLPKADSLPQLSALVLCAISIWVFTAFLAGQSAPITTALLGAFWALLGRRTIPATIFHDFILAALFWALCLKPSIAILPFMLLLGARAWRPFLLGLVFLLLTWIGTSAYYGGWWTGFWDYLYLLNHYHNADFTPFLQRGFETEPEKRWSSFLFSLDRGFLLASCLALVALRWMRWITGSEQFQGTVWAFLLLSPYLLPSENWIICLLVVEGLFFRETNRILLALKLLLLAAILDLRAQMTFPWQVDSHLKWLLFAWIAVEWLRARNYIPRVPEVIFRNA